MERNPIQATIERAWREVAAIEEAFASGQIDQDTWHAWMASLVVPAYLAGDNPREQSGYSGTQVDWRQARSLVADAIHCSGTFLDVGCASGLLMESVRAWCSERGCIVEPYGLDIAPELAALARTRLPQTTDTRPESGLLIVTSGQLSLFRALNATSLRRSLVAK